MSSSESEQETAQSRSLAELFGSSINEYSKLLFALGDEDCQVVKLQQISVEKALDGYGRLKVWGEQNRATVQASTRGSLDDTLRRDDSLKRNVAQILNLLIHQLEAAVPVASQKTGDTVGSVVESTSGPESGSDNEYSSDSSEDSYASTESLDPGQRPSNIAVLMSHIQEQIKLLYHLDALLRRPRLSGRYLKSTNDNRQVSLKEKCDYAHIEEKHRQWIKLFKSENETENKGPSEDLPSHSPTTQVYETWEDEPIVSQDVLVAREKCREKDDSHSTISRLARANTRRREQLRYWERHPFSKDIEEVASVTNKEPRIPPRGLNLSRDMGAERPKSLTSVPTVQSFSTVARSAIDETNTLSGRPRTVYAASVVTGRQSARVPDIPKAAFREDQVECPFCHAMLDSATIKSRMSWKRHVFRDLRPYTCTYEDCSNPDKMYATRHDWIYHEMQMHRRRWKCQKCDVGFHSKASMADHLREIHSESVATQLSIFLEMSERPIDDDRRTKCVLCPSQLSLSRLLEHLAQHMEEIALFVLPSLPDDDEDAKSNAARLSRDHDHNRQEDSPASSLGFSEIDWVERNRTAHQWKCCNCDHGWFNVILDPCCPNCNVPRCTSCVHLPQQHPSDFNKLIENQGPRDEGQQGDPGSADSPKIDKFQQREQTTKELEAEVEEKMNTLGKEDRETLEPMQKLIVAYQELGEYKAAKELGIQYIEGCKKVYGEADPLTMDGVLDLAFCHRRLMNLDEAERLILGVLEVDKRERGEKHWDTLRTLRDLSKIYIEAAKWDDAEEILTKTAETMAEVLGETHGSTLEVRSELALTYARQGKLEDAENLGSQTLKLARLNVPDDYVMFRALDNMARIYRTQRRKEEACATLRETIDVNTKRYGVNSPWTIESMEKLKSWEDAVWDT